MVSSLKRRKRDPMFPEKNRGPGWYYHRGHGYWSKWSRDRDMRRKSRGNDPKHVGTGKWKHTHDIIRRIRRGVRSGAPKLASPFKAFFNWLKSIWHPFKAWTFTLKLQKEAKERSVDFSDLDPHKLWEAIGENIDKTLKPSEAFSALYDKIAMVLGGTKAALIGAFEEIKQQLEEIEYQLEYGDLTDDVREQLLEYKRQLEKQLATVTRGRRRRR